MAEQQTEFVYRNIELYKSESLGHGSYGGVCKAKCDGLLCAAKIMHPTLFDLHDPGTVSYLRKFQEECRLLSLARHPNIVQYLATYCDPETRLPVLLMELCDESLTRLLERSPGPLPYHTQLNISHDIALALVYLHSNGLIHRDLTGNNVLMIAGTRAKITDFGMSKLATVNPRMTALTLCPGNKLYMSPEALDEVPSYSDKLDIFSIGVLQVQILTRQFPDPSERFRTVHGTQYEVRLVVPETKQRQTHLQLILDTHPLKPLALQCLKDKDRERPSAQQLSERLSELKKATQYAQSMQDEAKSKYMEIDDLRVQVKDLQQHNALQATLIQELEQQNQAQRDLTEEKTREISQQCKHVTMLQEFVQENEEKHHQVSATNEQLESSLKQRDERLIDLQRKIQQLEQQERASSGRPKQLPVTANTPQAATASASQKDITKLKWREGKKAPERMCRGAAVARGNIAYFNPQNSNKVYSYQIISGEEQWSRLPDNPNRDFGMAVIKGLVTSIGGFQIDSGETSTLLSLTGEGERWLDVFPPMPTTHSRTAAVTTDDIVVVAGGYRDEMCLDMVEVMNTSTKQWTKISPLPQPLSSLSGAICGDKLYLAGGLTGPVETSNSVLTCSITDLQQPQSFIPQSFKPTNIVRHVLTRGEKTKIWKEVHSLTVTRSTLATCGDRLLAIGGKDTTIISRYREDPYFDCWDIVTNMKNDRSQCLVATLPENRLVVVGGLQYVSISIDSVEILE